mmetsp:Transcript_27035/g.78902  ORF Transcript_27035/g.78902 Transcript_27035/m.78902 type:complete len:420 (+) Transcript_27035:1916-3175(+)
MAARPRDKRRVLLVVVQVLDQGAQRVACRHRPFARLGVVVGVAGCRRGRGAPRHVRRGCDGGESLEVERAEEALLRHGALALEHREEPSRDGGAQPQDRVGGDALEALPTDEPLHRVGGLGLDEGGHVAERGVALHKLGQAVDAEDGLLDVRLVEGRLELHEQVVHLDHQVDGLHRRVLPLARVAQVVLHLDVVPLAEQREHLERLRDKRLRLERRLDVVGHGERRRRRQAGRELGQHRPPLGLQREVHLPLVDLLDAPSQPRLDRRHPAAARAIEGARVARLEHVVHLLLHERVAAAQQLDAQLQTEPAILVVGARAHHQRHACGALLCELLLPPPEKSLVGVIHLVVVRVDEALVGAAANAADVEKPHQHLERGDRQAAVDGMRRSRRRGQQLVEQAARVLGRRGQITGLLAAALLL